MSDREDAARSERQATPRIRRDVVVMRAPTPRSDAVREFRLKKVANLNREKAKGFPMLADGTGN